jgi:2-polyprenyl-3-methyl-5-hydroxy-6-metoxy-1,4-benzoquinol methylase
VQQVLPKRDWASSWWGKRHWTCARCTLLSPVSTTLSSQRGETGLTATLTAPSLATHLPPNGRVLDLGCGTGANLARLLEMKVPFGTYVGVDLSEAMLARAERKWGDLSNVTFRQLDLMADPLPEGPFDLVTSTWVLEHLADPAYVVHQAWHRLRPGGHVLLLFEISSSSWHSRLWNRVLRFFSARVVPQEVAERFPGSMASDVFPGPVGDLALIVLHKPSSNERVAE